MSYRVCTQTVMDTAGDPDIRFDDQGICNYYYEFLDKLKYRLPDPATRDTELQQMVARWKKEGAGKQYDCIIGVSGGVDSSYVAYYVKEVLGLRPLAVHLDNGWNSELAVKNIENLLKILDIDLYTEVLNWDIFRDWQLSFLKASTPDAEVPTDHVIVATLYKIADKFGLKHIISGMNFRNEGLLPPSWARGYLDWTYLSAVQKQFGSKDISSLPHMTWPTFVYYNMVKGIRITNILNYLDFNKKEALEILTEKIGYKPYEGKHHESIYTRFFQSYILPKKFNIDKRKAHLTCLILGSNEISRNEALDILAQPIASPQQLKNDKEYVVKKFEISEAEFDAIMAQPVRTIFDYPNTHGLETWFRKSLNRFRKAGLAPR